jgi:hypothetical protein
MASNCDVSGANVSYQTTRGEEWYNIFLGFISVILALTCCQKDQKRKISYTDPSAVKR